MSDISSFLSSGTGPLGARVDELVRDHARLWHAVSDAPSPAKKIYGRSEKRAAEKELSEIVAGLSSEQTRTAFLDGSLDASRLEAVAAGLRPAFKRLLRLVGLPLEAVYDARFIDSTRRFIQAARDFDPGLSLDSAYQALRNVWIMNSLQFDLGLPVEHTDAVFAYSMVYPYLDNMLDDAREAEAGKLAFVSRLRSWLEGGADPAVSPGEEKLVSLVRLIERRFPRPEFPGVYRSLLAIYNAQVKSLLQQRPEAAPSLEDILAISLEKGGDLGPGRRLSRRRLARARRRGVLLRLRDLPPAGRRPPGHRRGFPLRPPDPVLGRTRAARRLSTRRRSVSNPISPRSWKGPAGETRRAGPLCAT